ncbi:MAG: FHIPEP family type III secretion protein [Planctomycetota bacterium]|jgi:hypothetical protein
MQKQNQQCKTRIAGSDSLQNLIQSRGRTGMLFLAGSAAAVVGLFVPMPTYALDIMLILSITLTAAVLIVNLSARDLSQITSLPILVAVVTTLRIALSVSTAKLILSRGDAGIIISGVGGVLVHKNYLLASWIVSILAFVIFAIICKAAKDICRNGKNIVENISTPEQTEMFGNSDSDRQLEIFTRTGFFVSMSGAGRFILCGAVIELTIVIFNIFGSVAATVRLGATTGSYVGLSVGAWALIQISSMLTAVSSQYLVRRQYNGILSREAVSESIGQNEPEQKHQEHTVQLQYGSTVIAIDDIATIESQFVQSRLEQLDTDDDSIGNEIETDLPSERLSLSEDASCCEQGHSLWLSDRVKQNGGCDEIAQLLESISISGSGTVLMTAEHFAQLPVSIPVNIGIALAQKGRKCLLVDFDFKRKAVAKVFGANTSIENDNDHGAVKTTCIKNLWLLPAEEFEDGEQIAKLNAQFDHLIFYDPGMNSQTNSSNILSYIDSAMLFGPSLSGGDIERMNAFREMLCENGCGILEPFDVLAGATVSG